jgi:hypothetical protein
MTVLASPDHPIHYDQLVQSLNEIGVKFNEQYPNDFDLTCKDPFLIDVRFLLYKAKALLSELDHTDFILEKTENGLSLLRLTTPHHPGLKYPYQFYIIFKDRELCSLYRYDPDPSSSLPLQEIFAITDNNTFEHVEENTIPWYYLSSMRLYAEYFMHAYYRNIIHQITEKEDKIIRNFINVDFSNLKRRIQKDKDISDDDIHVYQEVCTILEDVVTSSFNDDRTHTKIHFLFEDDINVYTRYTHQNNMIEFYPVDDINHPNMIVKGDGFDFSFNQHKGEDSVFLIQDKKYTIPATDEHVTYLNKIVSIMDGLLHAITVGI